MKLERSIYFHRIVCQDTTSASHLEKNRNHVIFTFSTQVQFIIGLKTSKTNLYFAPRSSSNVK